MIKYDSYEQLETKCFINRDNIVSTIDTILAGDTKVLFIEGDDGIGKTTLLREYNCKFPNNSIVVELDINCRWGSDTRLFVYQLYLRIHQCLHGLECDIESVDIPEGELLELLITMHKVLIKRKEVLVIIIDGLDDIAPDDAQLIINYLPLSDFFKNYKIVATGWSTTLNKYFKCRDVKSYPMSGFTLKESKEYLSTFIDDDDIVAEIANTSKGNPGYLTSIKRMVLSGQSLQEIVLQLPDNLPTALLKEWKLANITDTKLLRILALVAHECHPFTIHQLSVIFDIEESLIRQLISSHQFIVCIDEVICFISDAFRRFVEKELINLKNDVYDTLIDFLRSNPLSDVSIDTLPKVYYHIERYGDLISYLSEDVMYQVVSKANSLKTLKDHVYMGYLSALKIKKPEVIIGYALRSAAIASLNEDKVWKSEIDALMSLGEHSRAIEIANAAVLIEDRLAAYAQICKHIANKGEAVDENLLERIRVTIANIDTSMLGDRAIEIATDISSFDPELSINLIKSSLKVGEDPNSTDFAFAKLAIASMYRQKKNDDSDKVDVFDKHIANPSLQDITRGFRIISQNKNVSELISSVKGITDTSIQIQIICKWLRENRRDKEALLVTKYGIDLVLRKTDYSPNARVFYNLITPIEFSLDTDSVIEVIGSIDCQIQNILQMGPYEDYLRLQLLMAIGKARIDCSDSFERIMKVYYEICEETNLVLKCNTLSRALRALQKVKEISHDFYDEELEYVLIEDTRSVISAMFETMADHYDAIKNSIGVLCLYDLGLSLQIIESMNTKKRRDLAIDLVVRSVITSSSIKNINCDHVKLLKTISDVQLREELIIHLLEKTLDDPNPSQYCDALIGLFSQIESFSSDVRRCTALCLLARYQFTASDPRICDASDILDSITKLWTAVDNTWFKIDLGYTIVGYLAEIDRELSLSFLEKTKREREENAVNSYSLAETNIYTIMLSIRAFIGLLEQKEDTGDDLNKLIERIHRLPSIVMQIRLLTDIYLRSYFSNRRDISDIVCLNHIQPKTRTLFGSNSLQHAVVYESAPALYLNHRPTALVELKKLPVDIMEKAAGNIIRCILTKVSLLDPVDSHSNNFTRITFQQFDDIIGLLDLITRDYILYDIISRIADTFVYNERNSLHYIDRLQKSDIEQKLMIIIERALPWKEGINHQGYLIICKAQILRMFQPKDASRWTKLIDQANDIPNLADKCYVLSIVYGLMTRKMAEQNEKLINEIESHIGFLPTDFEKAEHLLHLAKSISDTNKSVSKTLLKKAWEEVKKDTDVDHQHVRRELIDFTYNLDHDLAASIVSMADDDPARLNIKNDVNRQINILEVKSELFKGVKEHNSKAKPQGAIAEASWKYLASLNANNVTAFSNIDSVVSEINEAANSGLAESYPIFACVIENLVVKNKGTQQAKTVLRPLFNYLLTTSDIIFQLTSQVTNNQMSQFVKPLVQTCDDGFVFVKIGERDKGIRFIEKWISESCDEYLYLCDQYLSERDLDILFLIKTQKPDVNVVIITSKASNPGDNIKNDFIETWKNKRSDDPLPATVFLMDYGDKHESPIHDRWWISMNSGLDFGTSYNSLGKKESKIRIMDFNETQHHYNEVIGYITRRVVNKNGLRIRYDSFVID